MSPSPRRASTLLALLGALAAPAAAGFFSSDREAEEFLRTARVVDTRVMSKGVTRSHVLTLTDGETTTKAVWKVIDEYVPIKRFDDGGPPELGFRDSYKSEIAAYRLDRMIGLEQVPPTVERKIDGKRGSLQLWIPGCITEGERRRQGRQPADVAAFNAQMRRSKVFFQLIQDVDYTNLSNLLIDGEFRVHKIDSSRAFRTQALLVDPEKPTRYSRSLLDSIRKLDDPTLKQSLGKLLSKIQRERLLERRDLIVERAERLVAEKGAKQALY